ncbi:MAG: B12-binding domain-containing radical SAM protein [Anaerolineae bacterium]|nr:B12-binding domain-containing radical SAM protein [Anaerolineae bacterium]NUQ03438.1 B12-binding domain-containing radical SAM protein [Anaerolineae bacterium]
MDILLAHCYFLYEDPHERQIMKPYPPLGILHLSSYLKQRGFSVGVFDSTFADLDAFRQQLAAERPPVVGLYVNLMTKFNALKMMRIAKAQGCTVILGGPEPPSYAAQYLERGADIVVKGEGETALEELLPHLARRGMNGLEAAAGIAYRDRDGQVRFTPPRPQMPDLSANPLPDREAIAIESYMQVWKTHHGQSSVSVIQARGCPYTCTWCSHSVYGSTHRRRTPDDAADELLWIKERYNPDLIWYADDVFAINRRWFFQYAEALKKRGVRIPFECISRADRLDDAVIEVLAEMGCFRLWNGSESGSQRILDAMRRKVDAEDVRAVTKKLKARGIETGMFIMLGYEGEEILDLRETTAHLKDANPDIFLTTVAYPIKGTPYYAQVEDRIVADQPWEARSDRDLIVVGRRSRRFYRFATRWMVSEVALNRARQSGDRNLPRQAKLTASALVGRVGMALTQGERETAAGRASVREQADAVPAV